MDDDSIESRRVKFAQTLKWMREDMVAQREYERLRATLDRERYLALIKEGFEEWQALELCKRGTS